MPPRSQQSRSAGCVSNSSAKQCDKEQKRLATLEKYSSRYTCSSSWRSTGASASSCNAASSSDANADSFMDTSEGTGEFTSGRRVAERGDLVALAASRSRAKLPSNAGDANKADASSFRCCAAADGSQQCRCAAPPPPPEFDVYLHLLDILRAVQDGVVSWRRLRVPYKYEAPAVSSAKRQLLFSSVTYCTSRSVGSSLCRRRSRMRVGPRIAACVA